MVQPVSSDQFFDALAYRHSVYGLTDQSPISNERIQQIVEKTLHSTPSAFNTQTTRVVLVLGGEKNKKFWQAISDASKVSMFNILGQEKWNGFESRFKSFAAAYGTALFFEDEDSVNKTKQEKPEVAAVMPQFAEQTNAMHQIVLWTALELENFGANLQHYYAFPGVADAIRKELDVPASWSNKAQLVFGAKAQPHPEAKDKLPISQTLKVIS